MDPSYFVRHPKNGPLEPEHLAQRCNLSRNPLIRSQLISQHTLKCKIISTSMAKRHDGTTLDHQQVRDLVTRVQCQLLPICTAEIEERAPYALPDDQSEIAGGIENESAYCSKILARIFALKVSPHWARNGPLSVELHSIEFLGRSAIDIAGFVRIGSPVSFVEETFKLHISTARYKQAASFRELLREFPRSLTQEQVHSQGSEIQATDLQTKEAVPGHARRFFASMKPISSGPVY